MSVFHDVPPDFLRNFYKYTVLGINFERTETHWTVTVKLSRESVRMTLVFDKVRTFSIEEGFPDRSSGILLQDLSDRGLDGIRVATDSSGASPGLRLFAAGVRGAVDSSDEGVASE
jgi:hypothetical protein